MKAWLRVLPFPILIFAVLTFLDYYADPNNINWLLNIGQSALLGAIGCVGQYQIHKNIIQDTDDEDADSGCIGCGKN